MYMQKYQCFHCMFCSSITQNVGHVSGGHGKDPRRPVKDHQSTFKNTQRVWECGKHTEMGEGDIQRKHER